MTINNLIPNRLNKNRKSVFFAVFLAFLLASSMFAVIPAANARDINTVIPTYAYLQVIPNPVGVGQTAYIAMWLDKVPPTANGLGGDRWQNMTLTETLPDGTTTTLGPFTSDNVGGANAHIVPTQAGNYTFTLYFPGQTIAVNSGYNTQTIGDVYGPSHSSTETLTVTQEASATVIPENPLPTGYWQNPVEAFNHNWNVIDGNWLGIAPVLFANSGNYGYNGNFNPYSAAITTGHIVWTKPLAAGGQLGGEFGNSEQVNYYTGMQYQPKFAPIIMDGVLYYTLYPGASSNPEGWVAVNLRTGQTLWTKNTTDILLTGQIYNYKSINQYGGIPYLWATRGGGFFGGGSYLDMFDAFTGNLILTIQNVASGGLFGTPTIEGQDGSLLQYFVNASLFGPGTPGYYSPQLELWNSSQCILGGTPGYYLSTPQWGPPQGASINFSLGIMWTAPLPTNYSGNAFPMVNGLFGLSQANLAISAIDTDSGVIIMTVNGGATFEWQTGWQVEAGFNITNGQMLWMTNRTETPYTTVVMGPSGNGIYTEYTKETMSWMGYSTLTGEPVWGPTPAYANQLGYYDQDSAVMAYGTLYTWTFGGEVYAYNITNGNLEWTWNDGSAGENTPYGVNPLWIIGNYEASVAGGILYVETGHNYGPPLFSGAQLYAINATTGKLIWKILNFDSTASLPIVDGYMLALNSYDNQIYCYGKGLSGTTVTAPTTAVTQNTPILVQGTVTDQGPGQTCLGIPAKGTPAISDASMSAWMEYLYEQSPEPMNATGVPVTISEVDPNNNTYVLGTTTSDITGNFAFQFTPTIPGIFTIIATFAGSGSYFSSSAETHLLVTPPSASPSGSATTPSPAPTAASPTNTPIPTVTPTTSAAPSPSPSIAPPPSGFPIGDIYVISAAIIVIAIVAAAALILRRRH